MNLKKQSCHLKVFCHLFGSGRGRFKNMYTSSPRMHQRTTRDHLSQLVNDFIVTAVLQNKSKQNPAKCPCMAAMESECPSLIEYIYQLIFKFDSKVHLT